jgi:phytol kinase
VDASAMVMLAEAAAWWGLDNLIIPIWGYMVLKSLLQMDAPQLSTHLVFLISLSGFMYLWRSRTTLGDDALAGSVLWGYVVWAVGGWQWALAPLLQLAAYATVTADTPMDKVRNLGFPVVLANTAGSIPWLLAFRETGDTAFFVPFVACYAANTAIITLVRTVFVDPGRTRRRVLSFSAAIGMLVGVPSLVAVYGLRAMTVFGIAASLVAVVAATLVFARVQPRLSDYPVDYWRWLRQAIVVGVGSIVALGIEHGQLWIIRLMGVT